jgi:hypothetical protein
MAPTPSILLQKTVWNESFNKCFKPSRLCQKPLYWIKASTNAPPQHQSYFRKLNLLICINKSNRITVALKIIIVYMRCHSNTETNQAWAIFKALKSDIRSHTHTLLHTQTPTHAYTITHKNTHTKVHTKHAHKCTFYLQSLEKEWG